MRTLKDSLRLNSLKYTLVKRNEKVALYGVGGTYSDNISHWEVWKIPIRKDMYGERESPPSNEQFGRDLSRCFNNEIAALRYFDELTDKLNLSQGVPKVISGVGQFIEVAA